MQKSRLIGHRYGYTFGSNNYNGIGYIKRVVFFWTRVCRDTCSEEEYYFIIHSMNKSTSRIFHKKLIFNEIKDINISFGII